MVSRHGPTDSARHGGKYLGARRHRHVAFGLAVELINGQAEAALTPIEQLGAQRFAAAGHGTQSIVPALLWVGYRAHHLQCRRRQKRVAYLEILQKLKGSLRRELLESMRNDCDAMMPGRQQHIEQAAYPGPVRRR